MFSGKKSHSSSKLKRDKERRGEGGEKHKLSKEERRERKLKKKQKAVSSSTAEDSPVKVGHIPHWPLPAVRDLTRDGGWSTYELR